MAVPVALALHDAWNASQTKLKELGRRRAQSLPKFETCTYKCMRSLLYVRAWGEHGSLIVSFMQLQL